MFSSDARRYGLSLSERAQMLHAYSRCLLILYADTNRLLPNEGLTKLSSEAHQAWEQLQVFKCYQLSQPKRATANFLSLEDVIDTEESVETSIDQTILRNALHSSNAASFAHLTYQFPTGVSEAVSMPADWPIRSTAELIEAQHAFWKRVVPMGETNIFRFADAIEAYVALCCQIIIQETLVKPQKLPPSAKIRGVVEESLTSEHLASALAERCVSSEEGQLNQWLQTYATAATKAADEVSRVYTATCGLLAHADNIFLSFYLF